MRITKFPAHALVLAAALLGSPMGTYAAETPVPQAPLAPGKPAGVKQAQIYGQTVLWVALGAAFIGGIILLSDNNTAASASGTGH